MTKTITVKGIGAAKVKPDYVKLTLSVGAIRKEYDKAIQAAAEKIERLQAAIMGIGYEKSDLKTMSFDVDSNYESVKDRNGRYNSVFVGYDCTYSLSLSFDFDNSSLSKALNAISDCGANPELSIEFTVKNPAQISEELLWSASLNAKKKAEILCAASGATLGELLFIDYNWGEINVISKTRFLEERGTDKMLLTSNMPEIEPDDINASDTATFVWEIKS